MIQIKVAETSEELKQCLEIRRKVFIEEQNVEIDIDIDGMDDKATHFIIKAGDICAGTARILINSNDSAKIQRVAILKEERGKQLGRQLMLYILEYCRNSGIKKALLASQIHALSFYEKLGFVAYGEIFMDAGIPHCEMELRLI